VLFSQATGPVSSDKLVRLSAAKTANAERRLAVCRLPFRLRCSSVKLPDDKAELGTRKLTRY